MAGSADSDATEPSRAVYQLDLDVTDSTPQISSARGEQAWNEPLLRQNAIWFCHLRWIVISVLGIAGFAGFFPGVTTSLGLQIAPFFPLTTASLMTGMNLAFIAAARQSTEASLSAPVKLLLWAQIVCDLLILTAVIHWLGTGFPSVPFMYLFHIILACIVFPPGESLLVAGMAAGFYLTCLLLEVLEILPPMSVLNGDRAADAPWITQSYFALGVGFMLLIWAVIWHLVSRLAATLQHREHELALTNLRLNASSEERAKHMLQTTHQLKAPFAAIHAQTQLLLGNYCGALSEKTREMVEKISGRCLALSRQIQEMLQLANLRSQGQSSPPRKQMNLAAQIEAAIARVEPAARQRGIRLHKELEPVNVNAVEDHLTMVLDNLVVNAVNYSYDGGEVKVSCQVRSGPAAVVTVRDHGIGIPQEKLPHIFDDYYRTDEAVRHNRTSTGLGLAIVRQAARQANFAVQVESAIGWGTCFRVTIPVESSSAKFILAKE